MLPLNVEGTFLIKTLTRKSNCRSDWTERSDHFRHELSSEDEDEEDGGSSSSNGGAAGGGSSKVGKAKKEDGGSSNNDSKMKSLNAKYRSRQISFILHRSGCGWQWF